MNLYDLHPHPETLKGYHRRFEIPQIAFDHAMELRPVLSLELEQAIAKDSKLSYQYAFYVLNCKRFHLGEPIIATDPGDAYCYAYDIIKGEWPVGESAIATDPKWSLQYAERVLKGRFPRGERAIASDYEYRMIYESKFEVSLNRFPVPHMDIFRW